MKYLPHPIISAICQCLETTSDGDNARYHVWRNSFANTFQTHTSEYSTNKLQPAHPPKYKTSTHQYHSEHTTYLCIPQIQQQIKNMQCHSKTHKILKQSNTHKRFNAHIVVRINNIGPCSRCAHNQSEGDKGEE